MNPKPLELPQEQRAQLRQLLLQGRLQRAERDYRLGLISQATYHNARVQIVQALH